MTAFKITLPKTQAALLEAMQERSVTIAGVNYKLALPYFVLATQNPIEQEGTYPLPEAQLDRFMFAIKLEYPSFEEEVLVVKRTTSDIKSTINPLFTAQEIIDFQHLIRRIPVADNVIEYAVSLVSKTRPDNALSNEFIKNYLDWGAGPRASQNLILAAKANAAFNGKFSPDIEDVKAVAIGILRHRIIKNYKADAEGITEPNDNFITQLVDNAEAAINAVDALGYINRKKVAVGGHSYGAFMTANLLTHSNLFTCGIARSGAYNRTLTPFGFQSEQRNYWETPLVYNTMSPFMNADKMKTPMLLVHGEADNNPGTFTLQTERYFQALKGLGAPARMVILPKESHGYAAKENILHLLWEQDQFLEKYLKN